MFDTVEINESFTGGAITQPIEGKTGRYRVRLIEGNKLGSSGYYPEETLRRDGPAIFKIGTPMFFDHITAEEKAGPLQHGSVTKLAAKQISEAVYEGDGLYADIQVYEHQRGLIEAIKDDIGISIRALGLTENREMNGRKVPVFTKLLEAKSADFVVKAGAGGKIMAAIESSFELIEESENMLTQEQIDEIVTKVATKITPAVEAKIEQTEPVVDYEKVVELVEALAGSSLDAEGRTRVLELHKANGKDIASLITAEESYQAKFKPAAVETKVEDAQESAGEEESVETEAEESAGDTTVRTLPGRWNKGN